jgi:hypothetical protein
MASKIPTHDELKPRTKVTTSGFEGRIVRQYSGDMYEVQLASGVVCVDRHDIVVVDDTCQCRGEACLPFRTAHNHPWSCDTCGKVIEPLSK